MRFEEGQLFILKYKEAVFTEPTLAIGIDYSVLTKLRKESFTLPSWRKKFETLRKAYLKGVGTTEDEVHRFENLASKAASFKTPSKRVRDPREDPFEEDYVYFMEPDEFSPNNIKDYFLKIDKAFRFNQKEHDRFRDINAELEDTLRETSYANDCKHGLTDRKIGKRPKILDPKFNQLDLFSVIGAVAAEVVDLSERKIESTDNTSTPAVTFEEEFKLFKRDTDLQLKEAIDKIREEYENKLTVETMKMKRDLETQIKHVRSGWVNVFTNMKNAVKGAVTNLRESIDDVDNCHSSSLVHHAAPPPDLQKFTQT